jgi:subtilisin family serine protease
MKRKQRASSPKSRFSWTFSLSVMFLFIADSRHLNAAVAFPPPGTNTVGSIARVGKLEIPLINYITQVGSNTPISILVVFKQQFSNDMKRALYASIYQTNATNVLKVQRQALIQRLRQLSSQSQTNLLSYLSGQSTNVVENIRPLWIANMIGLHATAPIIVNLTSFNEVDHIHLDLPRQVLLAGPIIPWNIRQIGADALGQNFSGQPVVVAVLDTGVNYTNRDLQGNLWANPGESGPGQQTNQIDDDHDTYVDDVVGIDIPHHTGDPMDPNGHGTEVAGIIAGNGAGGTRTGVCLTAQIMALRETGNTDRSTELECFMGIQYAFDKGAPILNFSSGWADSDDPDYSTWRITIEITSDQMLFVTGSGNNGNINDVPFSITVPGRVPLALTVGYGDQNNEVVFVSPNGPVTWTNVPGFWDYPYPPGLNKPDLVAPGAAIKSLNLGDGYTGATLGGSSMAAAHVSGAAALLLSQNPLLSPYTVRFILEETAANVDGLQQPDPGAGWGRVQANAALTYSPDLATPYDLAISHIRTVPVNPSFNQPVLVYAQWTNMGGQVSGNSEVRFFFADAQNRSVSDLRNGNPKSTKFSYIGSYFVTIIGPSNSMHRTNEAAVLWTTPSSRHKHWWLGAWVFPGAASPAEGHPNNNGAVFKLQ